MHRPDAQHHGDDQPGQCGDEDFGVSANRLCGNRRRRGVGGGGGRGGGYCCCCCCRPRSSSCRAGQQQLAAAAGCCTAPGWAQRERGLQGQPLAAAGAPRVLRKNMQSSHFQAAGRGWPRPCSCSWRSDWFFCAVGAQSGPGIRKGRWRRWAGAGAGAGGGRRPACRHSGRSRPHLHDVPDVALGDPSRLLERLAEGGGRARLVHRGRCPRGLRAVCGTGAGRAIEHPQVIAVAGARKQAGPDGLSNRVGTRDRRRGPHGARLPRLGNPQVFYRSAAATGDRGGAHAHLRLPFGCRGRDSGGDGGSLKAVSSAGAPPGDRQHHRLCCVIGPHTRPGRERGLRAAGRPASIGAQLSAA
jgi:hypothetical protein